MSETIPWVLLRGLIRDVRHWHDFPQRLAEGLGGVEVTALDMPGNGVLNRQRSPARIEAMVAYARAELLRRGVPPPYRLFAISLGGMVAAAWADAYPDEIDAAVLVNTSLRPFSPFWQRLRASAWPTILRVAVDGDARRGEQAVLKLTSARAGDLAHVVDDWFAWRLARPVSHRNAVRQLRAAIAYRAPQHAPAVRLLIVVGLGDRLVDPRCSQRLAQRWRVPIVAHPTAGHDLPLDDAPWLIEQVRRWLAA
jgi:pimeloyl-ACP methyl ester carboxylesterase